MEWGEPPEQDRLPGRACCEADSLLLQGEDGRKNLVRKRLRRVILRITSILSERIRSVQSREPCLGNDGPQEAEPVKKRLQIRELQTGLPSCWEFSMMALPRPAA